jgi:hypothetical protein
VLTTITLDNSAGTPVVLHETPKRAIAHAGGLTGIGALRDSLRPRPNAHGAINETQYEDGRLIVLEGAVWSQVSQSDAWAEWDAITTPMIQTLDVGPALLKWTRSSGLTLQRLVKLAGEVDPPIDGDPGGAMLRYQAQFYAEDPRAYSQTLTTATGAVLSAASGGMTFPERMPITFSASGGGTVAFTNNGNRPTPVALRIYGRCVNPQIVLLSTGARLVFQGEVPLGQFLELDTATRSVTMNDGAGTSVRASQFYVPTNSTWWECAANATTTMQLVASDFDGVARCDAIGRSAYV